MVGVLMLPETIHRRLDSVEEAGESRMTGRLSRPVWRGEENHPRMRWYPSYLNHPLIFLTMKSMVYCSMGNTLLPT
jgi:hypothetical protein